MPDDEVHEEAGTAVHAAPGFGDGRTGARHAAPRKPLLTRLHVPAGKAIAMAAMPSAVLMGMGLTPQLANAKPLPKNPFKSGSCVSQEDRDEEKEEKEKAEKEAAAKKKAAEAKKKAEAEAEKKREAAKDGASGESGVGEAEPSPSESSSSGSGGSGGSAEPEPSPSEPEEEGGGLLGGVGDALGDVLSSEEKEAAEAAPSSSASDSGSGSSASDATKPVEDTVGKVGDGLKETTDKLGENAKDLTEGAKSGKQADKGSAAQDGSYPCVEEKKVAGDDEQTPATLPNDPWQLEASSLGLHGLDYEGVRNVRTQDGRTKQVLKFTADSLDIGDLHQIVNGPDGTKYHVRAAQGSTSTIKGGKVTMYTERLQGNLFGLIPIVFDPEHPPPLNVPEAYFTDVKVTQAGQFGGNLTVPGLRNTIE
ncbi:MAG: hypothetical protein ACRDP3_03960 [Streptomyces sp.]|uniref:hypothetical protein n=1 Tax=Streptomyces sp. TaxID=1931 RepID=UPI003D6C0848